MVVHYGLEAFCQNINHSYFHLHLHTIIILLYFNLNRVIHLILLNTITMTLVINHIVIIAVHICCLA